MRLEEAIRAVFGVTMRDIRSSIRTQDRTYARLVYAKLSGKSKAELAYEMKKVYTTISYFQKRYDELYESNIEFRTLAERVKGLVL